MIAATSPHRSLHVVVHDDVVEPRAGRQLARRVVEAPRELLLDPRSRVARSRRSSSSTLGGASKIRTASGTRSRTWRAPWTSISRSTSRPAPRSLARRAPPASRSSGRRRPPTRAGSLVHHPSNCSVGDEPVVDPVALGRRAAGAWSPRPRGPACRGRARGAPHDGPLADPGRAGDDEQAASCARPRLTSENRVEERSRCFAPSPRTRRLAGDVELLHDLARPHLPDPGERLEHRRRPSSCRRCRRPSAPGRPSATSSRTSARPSARRGACEPPRPSRVPVALLLGEGG